MASLAPSLQLLSRCYSSLRITSNSRAAASAAHSSVDLVVPLCERPADFATTLNELLGWRHRAQIRATCVGSKFYELDRGPEAEELLRELEWYLEDAVGGCILHKIQGLDENPRELSGWKQVRSMLRLDSHEQSATNGHSLLHGPALAGAKVSLRASMEDLEGGWSERLELRRPFQYIVGCAHWRDFVLSVQEGVLIPRPETEQLVDLASAAIAKNESLNQGIWADLGTGSGALAIGIASLLKASGSVVAVDASDISVAVAEYNVCRCQLKDVVDVVKGSWFSPLGDKAGALSGVVSNPPYIPSKNILGLQAEVGKHEPICALDGGEDGIDHLVLICDGAASALKPGGFLALETNGGKQAEAVADYLSRRSFEQISIVNDFADIARFVTAYRS